MPKGACAECNDATDAWDGEVKIAQRDKKRRVDLGVEEAIFTGASPGLIVFFKLFIIMSNYYY